MGGVLTRVVAGPTGTSDAALGPLTERQRWVGRLEEREDRPVTMLLNAEPGPLGAQRSPTPVNGGITRQIGPLTRAEG